MMHRSEKRHLECTLEMSSPEINRKSGIGITCISYPDFKFQNFIASYHFFYNFKAKKFQDKLFYGFGIVIILNRHVQSWSVKCYKGVYSIFTGNNFLTRCKFKLWWFGWMSNLLVAINPGSTINFTLKTLLYWVNSVFYYNVKHFWC